MAKNIHIKKAFDQTVFTAEQIEEIERCMYGYDNPETGKFESAPIYFAKNYVRIQHPKRGDIPFILYEYQERMMNLFLQNNKVIVLSARQTGKEQPHWAKIATPQGWTTMGEITPGDVVLTPDGFEATVLQKHPQGRKPVYKVTFDDGSFAECGLDHLWQCDVDDDSAPTHHHGIRNTQEVMDLCNDGVRVSIPVVDTVQFRDKELPIPAYTMGAIVSQSARDFADSGLVFSSVPGVLERIQTDLQSMNISSKLFDSMLVTMDREKLLLQALSRCNIDSKNRTLPELYLTSSESQRIDILCGILDNLDGIHIGNNGQTITAYSISYGLMHSVRQLVWSLGGKCTIIEDDYNGRVEVNISMKQPNECFKYNMERKLSCVESGFGLDICRTVVDVTVVDEAASSCITIDHPDQLYITDSYTVTHNSVTSSVFLLWFAIFNPTVTVLIAANRNANAMEMIQRIQYAYEYLPMWLKPGITDDGWNKHTLKFDNKSRIVSDATSANTGRGMSISLLYLDEFAFVAPNVQEEFWTSILPTLSTGGACIMTSTPNGSVDKFSSIWRAANLDSNTDGMLFKSIHVKWDEPPGRGESFKQSNIALLGELKWKQEYECCAGDTVVTLMDDDGNTFDKTMTELYNEFESR